MKKLTLFFLTISILALSGCSVAPLIFESNSYGMAIGSDNKDEPWNGELVINSYHLDRVGIPETSINIRSKKLVTNSNTKLFIEYFIEDKLSHCLSDQNREAYLDNLKMANRYSVLNGNLPYTAKITFLKKRKYSLEVDISNHPPYELEVFYPVENCSEIEDSMFKALVMLNHEIAHLYFIEKKIINNYTLPQNEYWAYKISMCSLLLNEEVFYVKTYNFKLNQKEQTLLKSSDVTDHGLATRIGMKKAYGELYSLAGTGIVKKDNPNFSGIKKWCSKKP